MGKIPYETMISCHSLMDYIEEGESVKENPETIQLSCQTESKKQNGKEI